METPRPPLSIDANPAVHRPPSPPSTAVPGLSAAVFAEPDGAAFPPSRGRRALGS
jgi:hypothetical protein